MNKKNCGCTLVVESGMYLIKSGNVFEIRYCPVHAAAFEMREALEIIADPDFISNSNRHIGYWVRTIKGFQMLACKSLALCKEQPHE